MKKKLNRRKFLGLSAMAGIAAALPVSGCKKDINIIPNENETEAIVIGSGFGGSVAALRLGQAGIKTIMFERKRIKSEY